MRVGVGEDERKEGWGWKEEEELLEEREEAVATFTSRLSKDLFEHGNSTKQEWFEK